jgi:hypothetical protein
VTILYTEKIYLKDSKQGPKRYRATTEYLSCAFRLSCPTLKIRFCGTECLYWGRYSSNMYQLYGCLLAYHDGTPSFGILDRLVVRFKHRIRMHKGYFVYSAWAYPQIVFHSSTVALRASSFLYDTCTLLFRLSPVSPATATLDAPQPAHSLCSLFSRLACNLRSERNSATAFQHHRELINEYR